MSNSEPLVQAMRAWASLGEVTDIALIGDEHGIHSLNYAVTVRKLHSGRKVLLKRVPAGDVGALAQAMRVQAHCATAVAPVASVIPTDDGALIDGMFAVQAWCDGVAFDDSDEQAYQVGQALGAVLAALKDCPPPFADDSVFADLNAGEMDAVLAAVANDDSAFGRTVAELAPGLAATHAALDQALAMAESPTQAVHLDCHPGNVLFDDHGRAVIVDFGNVFVRPRMLAAAFACHRFAGFAEDRVKCFFNAYQESQSLTGAELDRYPLFVAKEAMRRVNKILRGHFFNDEPRWDFELPRQLAFAREAEAAALAWAR